MVENLGKQTGDTDVSTTNRIQDIEERILGVQDTIEEIHLLVKEIVKSKKILDTNHLGNL